MFLHSTRSEACFGNVLPHGPASVKLEVRMVRFTFFVPAKHRRQPPDWVAQGVTTFEFLAHLAQYEEANEAIIATTIFCFLLVSTPWSSFLWLLRLCCVFFWCFVYVFQPFPLRDGSIYFGTAPWYFLSRYTSDFPEMLIPLTPNGLIVFRHDLLTYPYRPAGESLVLQSWLMSEPFVPDPLDERIVSLPAEIQGERLHVISLMTRLPENNFGPLALLNVYTAGTDTVTRVPVERFDIDLYNMADKHGALDMGLSYTMPTVHVAYGK